MRKAVEIQTRGLRMSYVLVCVCVCVTKNQEGKGLLVVLFCLTLKHTNSYYYDLSLLNFQRGNAC